MDDRLAYQVNGTENESAYIVFAKTAGEAKSLGMTELELDFIDVRCKRAKQYDKYTHFDNIPKAELLNNAWWFECKCGMTVSQSDIDDGEGFLIGNEVYCLKCKNKELLEAEHE